MNKQLAILAILSLCLPVIIQAQTPALEKIWETDTIVAVPESVLPDPTGKGLYVSLIDGGGWDADGKGGVGRLGTDGKRYNGDWITGLNAPKGMGLVRNRLFVADITEVVVINITHGKIEKKIPIEGAQGLNDITVDKKGAVYVPDSKTGKIYKIENDVPRLYMQDLNGVNGLKASGDNLYILARKEVIIADAAGRTRTITTLPNGGDGVEEAGNGDLIVSEWVGFIYYVHADGKKDLLLDTHLAKKNTADIYYDKSAKILYVPGFNAKTVAAYRLKFTGTTGTAKPNVLLMDAETLAQLKEGAASQNPGAVEYVTQIRQQADQLLDMQPVSVMFKQRTPPSGNKHDYMSQAPYFWYDSSKPNGLPYKSLDGQRNPEIYKITDRTYIGKLETASQTLALAWYFTGEEKYAAKAAQLLRRWFLEDSSRMTPHLEYGQAVPGVNDGRGIGIIETIALMGIADAEGLLEGAPSWTAADAAGVKSWYNGYLQWMLTSQKGNEEHHAKNNHGVWFLAQASDYALFIGDKVKAKELAEEGKARVESQIEPDGRMPQELRRTNSMHYSAYNLQAFFNLSKIASRVNVDLWNYQNKGGAGIHTALDWLRPYAMGEKKWEYQEISPYNNKDFSKLLMEAWVAYKEPQYKEYAVTLAGGQIPHFPY
ncbi:MAG: alginate lyase family protein [Chitinophagaceae bacterium]|nr:alginate lyase family protein [Chitinophagaceae bacterium]